MFWQLKAKGSVGKMCRMQFLDPPSLHSAVQNFGLTPLLI